MPDFSIQVDTRELEGFIQQFPQQMDDALGKVAEEIVSDAKLGMVDSPADGNTYVRGGVAHVASSPGNPPRPDTATLLNSVNQIRVGHLHRRVQTSAEHGYWMEYGTERGVLPRPWLTPVIEEWRLFKFGPFMAAELST